MPSRHVNRVAGRVCLLVLWSVAAAAAASPQPAPRLFKPEGAGTK